MNQILMSKILVIIDDILIVDNKIHQKYMDFRCENINILFQIHQKYFIHKRYMPNGQRHFSLIITL